jgi:hypothetical protein
MGNCEKGEKLLLAALEISPDCDIALLHMGLLTVKYLIYLHTVFNDIHV